MTNKEMLKADMLDILFENRNKEYGAYALRRGYDQRLLVALGIGVSLIALLVLLSSFGKKTADATKKDKAGPEVRIIVMPPDEKDKVPESPKDKPRPVVQRTDKPVAAVKYTSVIKIVPNETIVDIIPPNEEIRNKAVGTDNTDGEKDKMLAKPDDKPSGGTGNSNGTAPEKTTNDFTPRERNAEFPGGEEALRRFLGKNLVTPGELEAGDRKMVRIRFKVDSDGTISAMEIEQSGGDIYDKEVARVCKKMPRWKPAIQNGVNVPTSYLLPVTFMGLEQ